MKIRVAFLILISALLLASCAPEVKLTGARDKHYEILPMGATEAVIVEAEYCWSGWNDLGDLRVVCYIEAWEDEAGIVRQYDGVIYRAEAASFRPLSGPEE